DRRLAASRFTHERQGLAARDLERDTVDGADEACGPAATRAAHGEMLLEVVDGKKRQVHAASACFGAWWQAATWPGALLSSIGATWWQSSVARGQRPANTQPWMRCLRLGTMPGISASRVA